MRYYYMHQPGETKTCKQRDIYYTYSVMSYTSTHLQDGGCSGDGVSAHLPQQLAVDLVLKLRVGQTLTNDLLSQWNVEFHS